MRVMLYTMVITWIGQGLWFHVSGGNEGIWILWTPVSTSGGEPVKQISLLRLGIRLYFTHLDYHEYWKWSVQKFPELLTERTITANLGLPY